MSFLRTLWPGCLIAVGVYALAAMLMSLVGPTGDRVILRLLFELPMLLLVRSVLILVIQAIATAASAVARHPVAGLLVAGGLGWILHGPEAGGLGFYDRLQIVFALANAAPWLWRTGRLFRATRAA